MQHPKSHSAASRFRHLLESHRPRSERQGGVEMVQPMLDDDFIDIIRMLTHPWNKEIELLDYTQWLYLRTYTPRHNTHLQRSKR